MTTTMNYEMNDKGVEHFKIMDLGDIFGSPATLWETTLCGVHFMFSVQLNGSGHYFASAHAAMEWFEEEKERRIKARRAAYSERYRDRHRI